MTDKRITDLSEITSPALSNYFVLVDSLGANRKVTLSNMRKTLSFRRDENTPWMYGAAGDGVTDDTAAVTAALNAVGYTTTVFDGGAFLVTSQITIGVSEWLVFGSGGSIVRGTGCGANSALYATGRNNLYFENLTMSVASATPHTTSGSFVNLYRCNNVTLHNPNVNGVNGAGAETLFSGISTPDCNYVFILNPLIQNIFGNGCGGWNATGTTAYGNGFVVVGGLIKNVIDTGIGFWTGARFGRIIGTTFLRDNYTSESSYPGTGVDVAGAQDVDIQADFVGNCMGVRVLINLGWTNKGIRIHHSNFADQRAVATEYGTGIKVAMYGAVTENFDIDIVDNKFDVPVGVGLGNCAVNIADTHTAASWAANYLEPLIDRNRFVVANSALSYGVLLNSAVNTGYTRFRPGNNIFDVGANGTAIGGQMSNPYRRVLEVGPPMFELHNFQISGAVDQTIGYVYLQQGLYFIAVCYGAMDDGGSTTGILLSVDLMPATNVMSEVMTATLAGLEPYSPFYYFYVNTVGLYKVWADYGDGTPIYNLRTLRMVKVI